MRLRRVLSFVVAAAAVSGASAALAPSGQAVPPPPGPHYYVALGDSLSRGYMPGLGDTDKGYADDLFTKLHAHDPSLQFVSLGCSGETTGTMINGGKCLDRYPVGTSQLSVAEQFLAANKASVKYLTIDIGANDVDGCASGGSIDPVCVTQGIATITQNLQTILDGLTAADGGLPRSTGMTYYDPFLASWRTGTTGQLVAVASVPLLEVINSLESTLYGLHQFGVADVGAAFHSTDFVTQRTVAPYGALPNNVAYICEYTFMCSVQNIHATVAGYQLIADVFAARLS